MRYTYVLSASGPTRVMAQFGSANYSNPSFPLVLPGRQLSTTMNPTMELMLALVAQAFDLHSHGGSGDGLKVTGIRSGTTFPSPTFTGTASGAGTIPGGMLTGAGSISGTLLTGAGTISGSLLTNHTVTSDKTNLTVVSSGVPGVIAITSADPTYTDVLAITVTPPLAGTVILLAGAAYDVTNQSGRVLRTRLYNDTDSTVIAIHETNASANIRYSVSLSRMQLAVSAVAKTIKLQTEWVARTSDTATVVNDVLYTWLQAVVVS